jgi:hypothetical protein
VKPSLSFPLPHIVTRLLRSKMRELCLQFPSDCFLNEMKAHESASAPADWSIPLVSTFCLTPPGDLPTRKGFFDALLMGCIPVVCDRLSAHEQWHWNLGVEAALSMTQFIPCKRIMHQEGLGRPQALNHSLDFMQELIRSHREQEEVAMKRFVIARHASRLQYRLPEGEHRDTPFRYLDEQQRERAPPTDAFDLVIDHLLGEIPDIDEMVANPRDRGDWRGRDVFPKYPLGRVVNNLTHGTVPCLILCK